MANSAVMAAILSAALMLFALLFDNELKKVSFFREFRH
jgi:hypothetical protein